MRRGAVILNGISRYGKKFYSEIYPVLAEQFSVTVFETKYSGHARVLASHAVSEKFDFIMAAGGDGTLHQVVNGVLRHPTPPPLGLIPLGTGNDFARTCGLTTDPQELTRLLIENLPKSTDVGELKCKDENGKETIRYFINCCSIGMGPDVVRRLENDGRSLGPAITYLKSIVLTFFKQRPPRIKILDGEWDWHGKIRVLGVANAQSFGNSVFIAPDALIDDGYFNLFIAADFSTPKFIFYLLLLKLKKKIRDHRAVYRKVQSVLLSSDEACAIETEGELAGFLPADIQMMPGKIRFFRP